MRKLDKQVYSLIKGGNGKITQSYIASELGYSRMTISKSIRRLKEEGIFTINQPRTDGKFGICSYDNFCSVNPSHYNSKDNIIINLINKKRNIIMAKALLKKKDLPSVGLLIIKYYTNSLITIKTAIKLYKKAVFNIDYYTVCQAISDRRELLLLDNNKIPP